MVRIIKSERIYAKTTLLHATALRAAVVSDVELHGLISAVVDNLSTVVIQTDVEGALMPAQAARETMQTFVKTIPDSLLNLKKVAADVSFEVMILADGFLQTYMD